MRYDFAKPLQSRKELLRREAPYRRGPPNPTRPALSPSSKVVADDQAQLWCRTRIQASLQFSKYATARLHSYQNVESRLVIEVSEADLPPGLKALVNED